MSFMVPQMTGLMEWVEVDTNEGVTFVPNEDVGLTEEDVEAINALYAGEGEGDESGDEIPEHLRPYVSGSRLMAEVRLISGFGVRSSAPGYMDATDWTVYEDLEEARAAYEEERESCGCVGEDEEGFGDD